MLTTQSNGHYTNKVLLYNCQLVMKWPILAVSVEEICVKKVYNIDQAKVVESSVTRLCDLLHFGQLFKACCNNYFARFAVIIIWHFL